MNEDMIAGLTPVERRIMNLLRNTITGTAPMLREKLSYGVPYYFLKSRICFIWPASMPNSGNAEGVTLGFCKGYLMGNEEGLLKAQGRKEVFVITYTYPNEVNVLQARQWVHEAILIDKNT